MNFNKAEFYTSFGKLSQMPPSDRIEIAFSGRSNVGKSSLINKIFNRKALAKVSSVPGKTVTINFFTLENIYIVDLPGYGYAKVSKSEKKGWSDLIGGYLSNPERDIELVFQLVDMRHAPTKDDITMINFLIDNEMPFVIVFTKADKLKKTAREQRLKAFAEEIPCFEDITAIPFSAVTGEGIDEIRSIIEEIGENAEIYDTNEQENDAPTTDSNGFLIPRGK
ncbi:MAG: YihA family ribosome biogenesis GTP-binding protein [Ruminococcus sp.]|nr:YihA family ribosome biogenesis GTP-binding protein [Ruminococcus sp.]